MRSVIFNIISIKTLAITRRAHQLLHVSVIFFPLAFSSLHAFSQTDILSHFGDKNWKFLGSKSNFLVQPNGGPDGKASLRIGKHQCAFGVRVSVRSLSIFQFTCKIRSDVKGIKSQLYVVFYNNSDLPIMEYNADIADSTAWHDAGYYTEVPAYAFTATVGITRLTSDDGYLHIGDFSIDTKVGVPRVKHKPTCNLDDYMKPFWKGDTIYNETVLLFSKNGAPANGKLLFRPDRILSVKNFPQTAEYKNGADYTLDGNVITRQANSQMPFRADTSFDTTNNLAWFNTQSQWVTVNYTHHDKWDGPTSGYKGELVPQTMAKLRAKKPLRIAAFGMSITRGMDVSSYDTVPPYMPTYVDLFARELRKAYHYNRIKLFNAGLPGSVVDWGAQYADKYINPLKPDLVILDFGMNDFWRLTPDQFKGYMQTIISKIRKANPKVEFILLSNMAFDPDYVLESDKNKPFYQGNLEGYSKVLKAMETGGVANLDMYSISNTIYKKKKAKDCLVNPLHPNDYMARWYAQGLAALFVGKNI